MSVLCHVCGGQMECVEYCLECTPRSSRVPIGKPGDPCVEGDGRPSADGVWCGACHMAAEREMESYAADRAEGGIPPCDWFERQALQQAVLEAAIAWRDVIGGKLTVPPWAYIDVEARLADAVDALMAKREGSRE